MNLYLIKVWRDYRQAARRSDLRTMSEINRQMATGDDGRVAIDDEVKLETKDKETKEEAEKERKETIGTRIEKDENRSLINKEENRRKSSDFWLLWPEPSTRASMARFSFEIFRH